MPSATDSGKNSDFRSGSDCVLHIAHIRAARDKAWGARYHGIPNYTRFLVAAFAGAQQIAFESPVERGVDLLARFNHLVLSPGRQ
jgi:hypothetical protein